MRVGPLLRDESGQAMTEYIVLVILIALVVIFSAQRFGVAAHGRFAAATAISGKNPVDDTGLGGGSGVIVDSADAS